MSAPKLSVLMTVYNAGAFLAPAIESALAQDFADFEFVIVDDGSTDASAERVRAYADPRIRLHVNDRNLGQTPSLNIGLRLCRGAYVARLDADDLCLPGRFSRQVAYLDANPDIGILGGAVRVVDGDGRVGAVSLQPADDEAIRWLSMTKNPFHHPTVVLRRDLLERTGSVFDEAYGANQDYDLWDRLLPHTRAANLRAPLLDYRVHGENISLRRAEEQMRCGIAFSRRRTQTESGAPIDATMMAGIYRHVHGSRPQPAIPESAPGPALDALLAATEAFFARRGGGGGEARRLAATTAMRCWLVKPVGDRGLRLLRRIHRLYPGAAAGALRVLAPQIARRLASWGGR